MSEKSGTISDKNGGLFLVKSMGEQIISRIYGRGRGWAFSQKDFARLGTRAAIDKAFERLLAKKVIRRVLRGIYDYPKFSAVLNQPLSPDIDQVAAALARKFGWQIEVTGASALNLMGLSTQVPGRIVCISNGPNRSFAIGKQKLDFKHSALKETSFKLRESFLIVQGLKSLGEERVSGDVILSIRHWLDPKLRKSVLNDTETVSGWIYACITKICAEETN